MRYEPLADIRARADEIALTLATEEERAIFWKTIDAIDLEAAKAVQDKWSSVFEEFDRTGPYKYADLPFWIGHKVRLAMLMDLHKSPPKTILDIGMGAGHFAAVCRAMGHTVVGTDIVEPIYEDICALLKVDRRHAPSVKRQPLPDLGARFDLVTIIWQVFHVLDYLPSGDRIHWTPEDWGFLFDDLAVNHMKPGGRIYCQLNPNVTAKGDIFDAPLLDWAEARNARVVRDTGVIDFRKVNGPISARSRSLLNIFGR